MKFFHASNACMSCLQNKRLAQRLNANKTRAFSVKQNHILALNVKR
ncbi:hypothetical protein DINO107042_06110 [Dichelobacter nodosus]